MLCPQIRFDDGATFSHPRFIVFSSFSNIHFSPGSAFRCERAHRIVGRSSKLHAQDWTLSPGSSAEQVGRPSARHASAVLPGSLVSPPAPGKRATYLALELDQRWTATPPAQKVLKSHPPLLAPVGCRSALYHRDVFSESGGQGNQMVLLIF